MVVQAGAGSGDFHQYRMARRREQFRWARVEAEDIANREREEFEERKVRISPTNGVWKELSRERLRLMKAPPMQHHCGTEDARLCPQPSLIDVC